jgi:hypothetical protein
MKGTPSKINRKFWDMMFGKMKKLGTAIEMFKGPEMSIDDAEHYWVNDRIEYYETDGRLLTKKEMKMANDMWRKYGN